MAMSGAERQRRFRERKKAKEAAAKAAEATEKATAEAERHGESLVSYDEARTRKMLAQARREELRAAAEAGELISKAEVTAWMGHAFGALRSELDALPARFKMLRPSVTNEDMAALRRLIYDVTDRATRQEEANKEPPKRPRPAA